MKDDKARGSKLNQKKYATKAKFGYVHIQKEDVRPSTFAKSSRTTAT